MLSLGSSAQLGIGIRIALEDKFSGKADQVARNLKNLKNKSLDAVTQSMRSYRNNAAGIAAAALGATAAIGGMVEEAADFQHQINMIAIVGGDKLKMTRKQLQDFSFEVSQKFGTAPADVASTILENARQGVTTSMREITKAQIAVATAVGEPLAGEEGVAKKLLGIMGAYDLAASDFTRLSDGIVSVANSTMSSVRDIGEAMSYGAFTSKQFNIPLEMTLAMVGKLSQAKIFGSSAGTAIRNMLGQLGATLGPLSTKKSRKAWDMLGLDQGAMRNMANSGNISGVIAAMSEATKDMDPIKKSSILQTIFNKRGFQGIAGLFDSKNGNVDLASLYKGAMADEKRGIASNQASQAMNDLAGSIKQLKAAWFEFKTVLIQGIAPGLRVFLSVLKSVIKPLVWFAGTIGGKVLFGLAAVITPLIGIFFAMRAAAFTAVIALNSLAMTTRTGGVRQLLGAGLNSALGGQGRASNIGAAMQNAAGRWYVPKGQNVLLNGQKYGPGQFLPNAAITGTQTVGFLSKMSGYLFKAVSILGAISIGIGIISALYDFFKGSKEDQQRAARIDASYSGTDVGIKKFGDRFNLDNLRSAEGNAAFEKRMMMQTINVNVDGKLKVSQQVSTEFDDAMNQLPINIH